MRNSKVRRRIAAGKLTLRIRDLRNLGPRSETMLAQVGIHSVAALRHRGGLRAFLALKRAGATTSLNLLWALVGALDPWPEGRDWREVAAGEERLPLLLAVEGRDQARRQVLSAAGRAEEAPKGSKRVKPEAARAKRLGRGVASVAEEPWAPGLPFEKGR